jgi:zinc transport system substrate-binding protein
MNPFRHLNRAVQSVATTLIPALFCLLGAGHGNAAPLVAATIRPLYFIATEVTEGISNPALVLGPGQDPHEFALRPSERRSLDGADVLLWIGPSLEQPLAMLAGSLDTVPITLQETPAIHIIETGLGIDPHLWLSPLAATGIAGALATTLAEMDPDNSDLYRQNLAMFTAQMNLLQQKLASQLSGLQHQWVVDHYAYRYFVAALDLPPPLVLRESDNRAPGMRTVAGLRQAMAQSGINCIVAEPGANPAELQTLLGNPVLQVSYADPMGQAVTPGPGAYARLLEAVASGIGVCLGNGDSNE